MSHVRVFRALGHVSVAARRAWPWPPDVACGDAWAEDAPEGVSIFDAGCVVDEWVDGAVAAWHKPNTPAEHLPKCMFF